MIVYYFLVIKDIIIMVLHGYFWTKLSLNVLATNKLRQHNTKYNPKMVICNLQLYFEVKSLELTSGPFENHPHYCQPKK